MKTYTIKIDQAQRDCIRWALDLAMHTAPTYPGKVQDLITMMGCLDNPGEPLHGIFDFTPPECWESSPSYYPGEVG
jgi:hypothetical protein